MDQVNKEPQYKNQPENSNQYKGQPANSNQYKNQPANSNQYKIPSAYPNQYKTPQNTSNQYYNPQGDPNQGYNQPGYYGQNIAPQGDPNQGYNQPGYYGQNIAPQGDPNQGYNQPGYYGQNIVPQGDPNQQYSQAGYTNSYYEQPGYAEWYGMQLNDMNLNGIPPKKLVSRIGMALFIFSIVVIATQFLIDIPVSIFKEELLATNWYIWALTALSMLGTGFPVYYLVMKRIPNSPRREVVKLKPTQFIKIFFISVSAMYITSLLSSLLTVFIAMLKGDTSLANPAADAILNGNFIISLIYAVLIAPIVEELIFRKLLLDKLRRFGDVPAILFTGIAFGLFHMNLVQFFYAAALGFIFAYVTLKTNTIRYSIILHMMINFIGTAIAPLVARNNMVIVFIFMVWMFSAIAIGAVFFILNIKKIRLEKKIPVLKKSSYFLNLGTLLYFMVCFIMIIMATIS